MIHISLNKQYGHHPNALTMAPIMDKLDQILQRRYHCQIRLQSHSGLSRTNIYIPLDGTQQSFAEIIPQRQLQPSEIQGIVDLVEIAIKSSLKSAVRIDHLERLERHLRGMIKAKNVVRIEDFRRRRNSLKAVDVEVRPRYFQEVKGVLQPCLIQGLSESDILKIALEIHDRSHRYAFVHLDRIQEIDASLDSVGSVTFFVSDIAKMSIAEQVKTYRYLETVREKPDPLFVIGSLLPPQELVEGRQLLHCLYERLMESFIRLEKPLKDYDLNCLLDLITEKTNLIRE